MVPTRGLVLVFIYNKVKYWGVSKLMINNWLPVKTIYKSMINHGLPEVG